MSACARPRSLYLVLLSMLILAACGADRKQEAASDQAPDANKVANTATPPPSVAPPPAAVTQASWAPSALEELLAPIALYPDQLLTQILAASVNSQEVLDGGNWLLDRQNLQGDALDGAARQAGFGPAMRALLQFPTVVDMMCQQIDWTRQLGSAFSSDQKSVLDAVQRLRLQASQVGNLHTTPQQTVETKTVNHETIVEVKPADPQIVYVPQYNPQVVYTTPPPAAPAPAPATTTTTSDGTVSTETAVAAGLIGFGVGALLGHALSDDDDDYCCYPNWGHSTVVVGTRPFYPPAYAYRPAYGTGFRPAYRYNPPADYRYNSANNVQRGRYGNSTNINVDNTNYFNRFDNNQNLRAGTAESPLSSGRGANQVRTADNARADNWKGQSTYRGARDDATTQRLNEAAGTRGASERTYGQSGGNRVADASSGRTTYAGAREGQGAQAANRSARSANVDRGYGSDSSPGARQANAQRSGSEYQRSGQLDTRQGSDMARPGRDGTRAGGNTQRPGEDGTRAGGNMQRPGQDDMRPVVNMQGSAQDARRSSDTMQRPAHDSTRSGANMQRPDTSAARADGAAARVPDRSGDSAFAGARDSGSFERSASARGRASGGGRGGGGGRRR